MKSIANIIHRKEFLLYIRDSNGNVLYCENAFGFWVIQQYDSNGSIVYWENSEGYMRDNRP